MIFRLLGWFVVAVMFDGLATLLRFQVPGSVEPLIRFWKELGMLVLLIFYLLLAIRGGGVRLAVHKALVATWMIMMGLGVIEFVSGQARGTADPDQAIRALRMHYQYPLLFLLLALPPRRLPIRMEEKLFHRLATLSPLIVLIGCSQAVWSEAWTNSALVSPAVQARSIDVRSFEGLFRPFGTFASAFSFGHYCALITVFLAAYLLFHRRARLIYWLLLPVAAAGLWVSTIRASILGALAAVAYLTFVRLKVLEGVGIRMAVSASLILGCIATPFILSARNSDESTANTQGYVNRNSLAERVDDEWIPAWERLKKPADFVFGLGTGSIGGSIPNDRLGYFKYNAVDNYYLLLLVNHGIVGLIIWGAFVIQLWWLITRASMIETEVTWFLHATVALLVMGLGSSFFRMLLAAPPEACSYWILLGLAAARAHEEIQQHPECGGWMGITDSRSDPA